MLGFESLEPRLALASLPWNNSYFHLDVNGDGFGTAVDSLQVINEINGTGSHLLTQAVDGGKPLLDVTNDGWVSPIDSLWVINYLNRESPYSVFIVSNNVNETEYRLSKDNFHFTSVLRNNVTGVVALRTHPDQQDANGWGSTLYMGPFIGGADSSGGLLRAFQFVPEGIRIVADGSIASPSAGGAFGNWIWEATLGYDSNTQEISSQNGILNVELPAELATALGDLNLYRIHSNLLQNVPRRFHPDGDTGDMNRVDVAYAATADPRDFTWQPQLIPGHFPSEASNYLSVAAVGAYNDVDSQRLGLPGNIEAAYKPTLYVQLQSDNSVPMRFGGIWDQSKATDPYADNVGITPIVTRGSISATSMTILVKIASQPISH